MNKSQFSCFCYNATRDKFQEVLCQEKAQRSTCLCTCSFCRPLQTLTEGTCEQFLGVSNEYSSIRCVSLFTTYTGMLLHDNSPTKRYMKAKNSVPRQSPVSQRNVAVTDANPKNMKMTVSDAELNIFREYLMVVRDLAVTLWFR